MPRLIVLSLWLILAAAAASAAKIEGTVKDPSGAVIAGASVSAKNPITGQQIAGVTDARGRFSLDGLDPNVWLITVTRDGFESAIKSVSIKESVPLETAIELKIAAQETTIEVSGKRSSLANSDPNYRALRDGNPAEAYRVENIELKRDVGTLVLKTGQIVFLPPVLNRVAGAAFVGEGRFQMKPAVVIEERHLSNITGKSSVEEDFDSAVFYFTDATYDEIKKQARGTPIDPRAVNTLREFRKRIRHRAEQPSSMLEALVAGDDISNIDADVLAELYNPSQTGSFRAYLHGKKYNDLRFFVVPSGAMPALPSPEEVALLNMDPAGQQDGMWYVSHTAEEWGKGQAASSEDKRVALAQHYRIETAISKAGHLAAIAELDMKAQVTGTRMIRLGLIPELRVSRVTNDKGRELSFIQEARLDDGSLHVILPEPMVSGNTYRLRIEYEGSRVVQSAGSGNFAVGARTAWYPSLNTFLDRATYDLTFKVPKQYTLVGVGKLVSERKEGDIAVSEWKSDVPLAVAGFNYGSFKKKQVTDSQAKYDIEAYSTEEVPDYLKMVQQTLHLNLTPSAMADQAIVDGQNSMRLFQVWFGAAPYGRIAITQQPQFNFGQSWPTLVYLPLSAFLDSTQRWMMLGGNAFRFGEFIQEVTPHEVSHQWWGHMVGWATYHDQWLSEGFAEFSAGLFLEKTEKPDQLQKFWDRQRDRIIQKNQFGMSPNDAGPIWMGLRLNMYKSSNAYASLVYPKGAYVLQMLRMLMRDDKTGDQDFIAMMHDFVSSHLHKNATSESFMAVVEKHMKPGFDLEGNHRIDWFFRDWVYGQDIPKYRLEYSLKPSPGGKTAFTAKLTQSDVSPGFAMQVPLYFDFDGRPVRVGFVRLIGNSTASDIKIELPKKPKHVLLNANHDILCAEAVVKEI